jgi:hypothetical protein
MKPTPSKCFLGQLWVQWSIFPLEFRMLPPYNQWVWIHFLKFKKGVEIVT